MRSGAVAYDELNTLKRVRGRDFEVVKMGPVQER